MARRVTLPPEGTHAPDGIRAAGWWHEAEAERGRVVCDLCPRSCRLKPGQRGFCFVRQNLDGELVTTTYGRSTGFCVDPIEKKPLHQFHPGTAVLSFGTAGCNLGCRYCQNWTSARCRDTEAASERADPETIARAARRLGCRSVAFTYNDPIVFAEYAMDTARACRGAGVQTVAVTNGYINPPAREALFGLMDAANVDLKAFSEEFYSRLCSGRLQPVLDTLRWIARESDVWLEITNLVIPGENDSADELKRMCDFVAAELGPDVPLHLTAFHPDFKLTDHAPTPKRTLLAAWEIARAAGLHYVYTGNVVDPAHQHTRCPGCDRVVIERDGYLLGAYHLAGGRCSHCDTPIAGRFDAEPGNWGGRRLPVRIADFASTATDDPSSGKESTMGNPSNPSPGHSPDPSSGRSSEHSSGAEDSGAIGRPVLSAEEEATVFHAAGQAVAATVQNRLAPPLRKLLGRAADLPVYGAFVSLKRSGQLRSCCGYLGSGLRLGEALDHAAVRAAKDDPRFPPIAPAEMPHLDMEVWLLWGLKPIAARARRRADEVVIGRHGLQIVSGSARGLLLPGVAVEHGLDAEGFLRQVCLKAGLPTDAWLDDATQLFTFEGDALRGRLGEQIAEQPVELLRPSPDELRALAEFCRRNLVALAQGATADCYLAGGFDGDVYGVLLSFRLGEPEQEINCTKFSARRQMPLQTTLFRLTEGALHAVRAQRIAAQALVRAEVALTVLLEPAMHGTLDQPDLEGIDPARHAVAVVAPGASAWVFDPQKSAEELLDEAVRAAGPRDALITRVVSLTAVSTEPQASARQMIPPERGPQVRPPAVAGAFYPREPAQVKEALDELFAGLPEHPPEPWAGALVPHAGWVYSGRLAARTLSRVSIPEEVIVFCPKHRPGGADWAVAPHGRWSLPGMEVASDPELAAELAEAIAGLEVDAAAHQQEHAIEVQLPLIARLAPEARVVGVTIGTGDLENLLRFGRQLAEFLKTLSRRPLLVISTDMSHLLDEAASRHLDRAALEAIKSLDPAEVFHTVRAKRISMCGMLPCVIVMEALSGLGCLKRCEEVGYTTSAEAGGDTSRVVGYAGVLFG